jgi:hypothetical protein
MSAIGILADNVACRPQAPVIGAHADYRPEDFSFARMQSVALRAAKWESRIKPMHSWSEIGLCVVGLIALLVVGFNFV